MKKSVIKQPDNPEELVNGRSYAARDLIIDRLLPMARLGLRDRGIDADDSERYLDVIEKRVRSRKTGSQWILNSFEKLKHRRTMSERLSIITASIVNKVNRNRSTKGNGLHLTPRSNGTPITASFHKL